MTKYICIHGHFYQPPRENAWLEEIQLQESAQPFHDWNERITAECYGPNAASRILDKDDYIINIVNNYANISFNFGATLLSWMEEHAPEAYQGILEADKLSQQNFSGHGSAMAQVYNHLIMPLANRRDKETQVKWGIADFEHRFGRKPEGMWLAETAVDIETLEVLAEQGIQFTLLAPRQAHQVKSLNADESADWQDVSGTRIDTRHAYLCKLPSGKVMNLFFYNGPISQEVAFKGLLMDGHYFAERVMSIFDPKDTAPQLAHIATDGESYGHHHRHGDMALAFGLDYIKKHPEVQLTNYGEFLEKCPPEYEVRIYENSSWSCVHGVERWRSACGCTNNSGHHLQWRAPLRQALNWLRDELDTVFEQKMMEFVKKPWKVRNNYIDIILNRNEANVQAFIKKYAQQDLKNGELTQFIRLLEMQRNTQLMFTSCGWFFDDISRIEAIQILQYADRAMQLAENVSDTQLGSEFMQRLITAPSNYPYFKNGAGVFEKKVSPARLGLSSVAMHHAVYSLFEDLPENFEVLNYRTVNENYERLEAGNVVLSMGKVQANSNITYSENHYAFAVLYLGQHHIMGNTSRTLSAADFEAMKTQMKAAFEESNISEVIRVMHDYLGTGEFSFWNLLKDEQRKVLQHITQEDLLQAEMGYKKIYDRNYNTMKVLKAAHLPIPRLFLKNLEVVINSELRQFFQKKRVQPQRLEKLAEEVQKWDVELDKDRIAFVAVDKLLELLHSLPKNPKKAKVAVIIVRILAILKTLDIEPKLLKIQNTYFKLHPAFSEAAPAFLTHWKAIGEAVKVRV